VRLKIDVAAIQDLGKALRRAFGSLIALSHDDDPFYLTSANLRDTESFTGLHRDHGFRVDVHLRRIHYGAAGSAADRRRLREHGRIGGAVSRLLFTAGAEIAAALEGRREGRR
jgi:hypothetical protein